MSTIVTITFNPAIDVNTSVEKLISEKKMICSPPEYEAGGGGINVSRAIKKLQGDSVAVCLTGGDSGKRFGALLAGESIKTVITNIGQSTRENVIVTEISGNQQYRFGMPGPEIAEHEWKNCLSAIEHFDTIGYLVVSGSLPPGIPTNIYAQLAAIAKNKNARFIADTSGEALGAAIEAGVYLIKPNLAELSSLSGESQLDESSAVNAARKVISQGTCEVIVVSMGANGALLITGSEAIHIKAPEAKRKSTVGAGDSMLAGIVFSLAAGKSLVESFQYGVACGTAATMNAGSELCRKEDADSLYALIQASNIA